MRWTTTRYVPGGGVLGSDPEICVAENLLTRTLMLLKVTIGTEPKTARSLPDRTSLCSAATYVADVMTGRTVGAIDGMAGAGCGGPAGGGSVCALTIPANESATATPVRSGNFSWLDPVRGQPLADHGGLLGFHGTDDGARDVPKARTLSMHATVFNPIEAWTTRVGRNGTGQRVGDAAAVTRV